MSALRTRVVLAAGLVAFLSPAFLAGQAEIGETWPEGILGVQMDRWQQSQGALAQARLLADAEEIPPERLKEIHRLYAQAIAESSGTQRLEAYNSYGVFLLGQNEPERAAAMLFLAKSALELALSSDDLAHFWATRLEPLTHSRLLYNYGIALERSGDLEEAAPAFLQSFELDPSFMPACDAVFRTSRDLRVPVVERLLERGDLESVRDYLRKGFQGGTESYPELMELWARFLTAARIGPGQDRSFGVTPKWPVGNLTEQLVLIERAYGGQVPLLLDPAEGKAFTEPWQETEGTARAFSGLLQMIGDELVRQGRPREALPRYALAWSSAGNLEAATRLAGLLRSARAEVDPQGEVLDKLLAVFFGGAGTAYLAAAGPGALPFHTSLALLLESEEGANSADGPRSAVYQWERALAAAQQRQANGEPVPGLHSHLATAYKQAGRTDEAVTHFLAAGDQYLALGRPEAAETQLVRAEELATGKPGDAVRLAGLRTAIQKAARPVAPGGRTDGDITNDLNYRLVSDPSLRGKDWDVITKSGTVTISLPQAGLGEIDLEDFKDIVMAAPDVTSVEIKVDPPR